MQWLIYYLKEKHVWDGMECSRLDASVCKMWLLLNICCLHLPTSIKILDQLKVEFLHVTIVAFFVCAKPWIGPRWKKIWVIKALKMISCSYGNPKNKACFIKSDCLPSEVYYSNETILDWSMSLIHLELQHELYWFS